MNYSVQYYILRFHSQVSVLHSTFFAQYYILHHLQSLHHYVIHSRAHRFLRDFRLTGTVFDVGSIGRLSVGNSSFRSHRPTEFTKWSLQTLVFLLSGRFFRPILCIHTFINFFLFNGVGDTTYQASSRNRYCSLEHNKNEPL